MFQTDPFSLIVLFVGLSLLPFVAMVATSYLKIVVVMSLIRNALAMILTFYIMAPVMGESWNIAKAELAKTDKAAAAAAAQPGAQPSARLPNYFETDAVAKAAEPFRTFLSQHTSDRERAFFVNTAEHLWAKSPDEPAVVDPDSFYILIPSFCVSELTKSFQIGFLVYLPFIAIDIIVSNILLAMGMMMVSPVTISLPFKLLLFVMVNGWTLLIQGLVRGYLI